MNFKEELLKAKDELIEKNYQRKENSSFLAIDTAVSYILTQQLAESMIIQDVKKFDKLIEQYKDKINVLLTLNFYELYASDVNGIALADENELSQNINLLELSLSLENEYFNKNIISLLDTKKINESNFCYYINRSNDKKSFLKVIEHLKDEEQITDIVVALISNNIQLYGYRGNNKIDPFMEWLLEFKPVQEVIYNKTKEIIPIDKFFKLNYPILEECLKYANIEILNKEFIKQDIHSVSPYSYNNLLDITPSLFKLNILNPGRNKEEDDIISKLKTKYIDFDKKRNPQKQSIEEEKTWLEITMPIKKQSKMKKI